MNTAEDQVQHRALSRWDNEGGATNGSFQGASSKRGETTGGKGTAKKENAAAKYMVRAVSCDRHGKVVDIANTWPLNSATIEEAKAEVDTTLEGT